MTTHPTPHLPTRTQESVVSEEAVEAACRVSWPGVFSDDEREAHLGASPFKVEIVREAKRDAMRAALQAAAPHMVVGVPSEDEIAREVYIGNLMHDLQCSRDQAALDWARHDWADDRQEAFATARAIRALILRTPSPAADANEALANVDRSEVARTPPAVSSAAGDREAVLEGALRVAEAALSDIGDASREEGDDLAWCERRAAQALPVVRRALASPASPRAVADAVEQKALDYAEHLAAVLHAKHFPENKPWRPLSGDLVGILTQIDNMTSQLVRALPLDEGQAKDGEPTFPTGTGTGTYFRRLPDNTWVYRNHADQWATCATPSWDAPPPADAPKLRTTWAAEREYSETLLAENAKLRGELQYERDEAFKGSTRAHEDVARLEAELAEAMAECERLKRVADGAGQIVDDYHKVAELHRERADAAEAKAASPSPVQADDPTMDTTDFAHPAWWRGEEYGSARIVDVVTDILDGKHEDPDRRGVFRSEKLQALRERLLVSPSPVRGLEELREAFERALVVTADWPKPLRFFSWGGKLRVHCAENKREASIAQFNNGMSGAELEAQAQAVAGLLNAAFAQQEPQS